MTLEAGAILDPDALEGAVRKVDFTPTGVRVWLRGAADTDELPPAGADARLLWLSDPGTGQRFLLVADDDVSKQVLRTLQSAPVGSITVRGMASGPDATGIVQVHVEGSEGAS